MISELMIWFSLLIWVAKDYFEMRNYFALSSILSVFLLLIILLFPLLKNLVYGIIFKWQNKITEDVFIEADEIVGMVKKAGHLNMEIEDSHGDIYNISYTKVYSKTISKPSRNHNLFKTTLTFSFTDYTSKNEILSTLKRELMNTPWTAVSQPPIIENSRIADGELVIEVAVFVIDQAYVEDVKTSVDQFFKKKSE
ncbi:mechanosensitive ion channel domain-containing protein [Plebeiibacterium sediminum]|uniref:Mechanosensitive ion channel n=1 Tax=Plebeiibacterium sediminum TaxID=2992112 RepID=A0AAE3M6V4_9BACT|nr:mechanosensitive ion channel domain-containing protein [Plebeiobacterium sediminum]MCW3788198.1 mechanosensitive ion channel [Plebeiobacterium sediminum]